MHKKISCAIKLALFSVTATNSHLAFAQQSEQVERIEVTGSRIKQTDIEGANPITVIGKPEIEKLSVTNVGDLLQNLPVSAGAGNNSQSNNGSDGSIRFSLRGLGEQRTLILLNGRRIVAGGAGADIAVDLNTIPVAIIKRIEVLKDGASAVYGSDAIAGVVNIITRDDFEGVELTLNHGRTTKHDGEQNGVDITIGSSFDKGNAVIAMGFHNQKDVFMGDRDFSRFELRAYPDGTTEQGGSSAPPWSNVDGAPGSANDPDNPDADANVTRGPDYGDWRAYDGSSDSYNYNPVNYLQTPRKRYYISAFGSRELGSWQFFEDVRAFAETSYTKTSGRVRIAPEPLAPLVFFGTEAPYSPDNFYNQTYGPKDENGNSYQLNDWRRRMLETGGRINVQESRTVRAVFGMEGALTNGWEWEISYNYGENNADVLNTGFYNLERVAEAVGPTHVGSDGQLACGENADAAIDGCVPLNIFGEPGTDTEITAEMLQYISGDYNTQEDGGNKQQTLQFLINGDAMELPAGTLGFAAGWEYRKESGYYTPDALLINGITTAGDAKPTSGDYSVYEVFVEGAIPITETLSASIAIRYSDFDTFGSHTTGKLGVTWRPNDEILLRATASQAFRAPNTDELFRGAAIDFPEVIDPCLKLTVDGLPQTEGCLSTGVPVGGYNDGVEQIPTQEAGNPDLEPEEADILTVGVVYNPDFLDGFAVTLDYWQIEIDSPIELIGSAVRLDGCAFFNDYCDSVVRFGADSSQPGTIIRVEDPFQNVSSLDTSGLDFSVKYSMETSWGDLRFDMDTTYLIEYEKAIDANHVIAHEGRFDVDNDGHFARWKSNLSADWRYEDFSASATLHYISGVTEAEKGWWTNFEPFDREVASNTTVDVQGNYHWGDNITFTLGIDNLFDREPPFVFSAFGANTDVSTYDVLGRFFYTRAKLSF